MSYEKGVIVKSTAPTINDDGTKGFYVGFNWIDTSSLLIYHLVDNTTGAAVWRTGNGLFAQTAKSSAITDTVTETTLIGSGVGSLSVPADVFVVGDTYHAKIGGLVASLNNETIRIRVKSGSVVLADTGAITLGTCTSNFWEIEMDFTIRAIGAATTAIIITHGQFVYVKDASSAYEGAGFNTINSTTFDTTISNTLDVTLEWGSASASNSISSDSLILTKYY